MFEESSGIQRTWEQLGMYRKSFTEFDMLRSAKECTDAADNSASCAFLSLAVQVLMDLGCLIGDHVRHAFLYVLRFKVSKSSFGLQV